MIDCRPRPWHSAGGTCSSGTITPVSIVVISRERGTVDRPCRAAVARRHLDLGELRAGLHGVQQAEGRPHTASGEHEAPPATGPAGVETALRAHRLRIASWSKFVSEAYWNVPLEKLIRKEGPRASTPGAFTRACSWESKRPPKPPHGVRLLALVLREA